MSARAVVTLALIIAPTLCSGTNPRTNPLFPVGPGFTLSDSVSEFSLHYFTVDDLIVLPFMINGTIPVNLILDTGCQTLILFGRRFEKVFDLVPDFRVTFSGIGTGHPAVGSVALDNTITMGPILGDQVPIIVVPGKHIFRQHLRVDGLIGYDLFTRFEIEIHPSRQEIVFRPAFHRTLPSDYHHIPLRLARHRPTIAATFALPENDMVSEMLVDTGSSLSVLLTSSDKKHIGPKSKMTVLGRGINGKLMGSRTVARHLQLNAYTAADVPVALTYSPRHNYASIGMAFLKNYSVIINCVQGYLGLRQPEEPVVEEML